ncbi:CCA tRNA nucleotidyltransferase, mitochondrial [Aphanomyces cochlioides]|nr:CCA tRNA nucleotidyltransferase, mitochondrial [Aphanomyces cochlioides]
MTGEAFVKIILHFQNTTGVPVKGFYIVKKNAEQSKHLSCAAIKILGHELDFVHLRNESYSDPTSRIPTLSGLLPPFRLHINAVSLETLATPKEDAMRRDITINALFYNLSTRSIEDFTGKGLIDLDRGVIRTPLAPKETFLDDPLRVLRAVRFAAQYDFKLDSALRQAIQSERVQEALTKKVTRERIGLEVRKMLSGANPHQAMTLLNQARLEAIVFRFISQENIPSGLSFLQFVQASERNPSQNQFEKEQFDPRHMLASFMAHPLSNDGSEAVNQSIQAMLIIEVPVVEDVMLVEAALSYIRQSQEMDNQANKRVTDAIKVKVVKGISYPFSKSTNEKQL